MMMNNYEPSSKILFGIVVAVVSVISYWSSSVATTATAITNMNIQEAMPSSGATTTRTTNIGIVLPNPLYIEVDKTTSQKAVIINGTTHAIEVTFSGHGTARGLNYTDSGKGLIIPRGNNGVINTKGQVDIMSSSNSGKEEASATFEEIGHSDANGIVKATGAAFFDANATGKLAFLGNIVAVYKDIIYKDGTDKVVAWDGNDMVEAVVGVSPCIVDQVW